MEIKGHGTIKKSKAYGTIGTLLLSGALIATLGTANVNADETTNLESDNIIELVTDSSTVENDSNVTVDSQATVTTDENQSAAVTDTQTDSTASDDQTTVDTAKKSEAEASEENATESVANDSQATTDETVNADNTVVDEQQNTTEDTASDSQATVQSDKQEVVNEESSDTTVERGATGSATDEVTSVTLASNGFNLQYNQAIASGAKIMFAVWSDVNGQDDLIWYTADSNGKATAKYTGSYGTYYVHTYQNLNGKMTGLNGTSIDVPKPSAKVIITKASSTTYKVTVTGVPVYITSVTLPTWTENKGQDDIIWYKTTKDSSTTYSATISVA